MDCNTIMEDLKDQLGAYIKSSRSPCESDVAEIKRGIHGHNDIINRPFIGITIEKDRLKKAGMGNDVRGLTIILYCYMDNRSPGNYDDMFQMVTDLNYFLKYNFSHCDNTTVTDLTPIEGGVTSSMNYFDLGLEIIYQTNI